MQKLHFLTMLNDKKYLYKTYYFQTFDRNILFNQYNKENFKKFNCLIKKHFVKINV